MEKNNMDIADEVTLKLGGLIAVCDLVCDNGNASKQTVANFAFFMERELSSLHEAVSKIH